MGLNEGEGLMQQQNTVLTIPGSELAEMRRELGLSRPAAAKLIGRGFNEHHIKRWEIIGCRDPQTLKKYLVALKKQAMELLDIVQTGEAIQNILASKRGPHIDLTALPINA